MEPTRETISSLKATQAAYRVANDVANPLTPALEEVLPRQLSRKELAQERARLKDQYLEYYGLRTPPQSMAPIYFAEPADDGPDDRKIPPLIRLTVLAMLLVITITLLIAGMMCLALMTRS